MNGPHPMLRERSPKTDERLPLQEGSPMSTTLAEPLTASDRCDRCGAQAYLRVTLPSGGELLFCGHHGRAYEDKLKQVALNIHDETAKLN